MREPWENLGWLTRKAPDITKQRALSALEKYAATYAASVRRHEACWLASREAGWELSCALKQLSTRPYPNRVHAVKSLMRQPGGGLQTAR